MSDARRPQRNSARDGSTPAAGARTRRGDGLERLAKLAAVGAAQAAAAFAQLAGREIRSEPPIARATASARDFAVPPDASEERVPDGGTRADVGGSPDWCTGVLFEFEGCLDAIVAILFPGRSSEALVRRIVGVESGEVAPPMIESALMEVGNILASHVASGIADHVGERLLPSIPSLAMAGADEALFEWIRERGLEHEPHLLCVLRDADGELEGRLVVVPTDGVDDARTASAPERAADA